MFFNSAEREEERKKKEADDKKATAAIHKSRHDEMMKTYYLEQAEAKLIQEAQEAQYVLNRKQLYTMPHYTRIEIQDDTFAERVPGGWIFYRDTQVKGKSGTSTFVPFAEEKIEMFYKLKNG